MDIRHPDIEQFVNMKHDLTKVTGANVSVKISDSFMQAVEKGEQFMFCCLDSSDALLSYFKNKYNWDTVPMIIEKHTEKNKEKFIGGFTDLANYLGDKDGKS